MRAPSFWSCLFLGWACVGRAQLTLLDARFRVEELWGADQGGGPVQVVFSPVSDHVFTVHKAGFIMVHDSADTSAPRSQLFNIEDSVYSFWDHGLLSFALHPEYPAQPYGFVFYAAENSPPWDDFCAYNAANGGDGYFCKTLGRLLRITITPSVSSGTTVSGFSYDSSGDVLLIEDWCAAGLTHHTGTILFLSDQSLVLAAGDGSQESTVDTGFPADPCYVSDYSTSIQGSFRAQYDDFLQGKLLRITPDQYGGSGLIDTTKIQRLAKGLRNPYRMTLDPRDGSIYIGDVGSTWAEEINHVPNPLATGYTEVNFGWPCMEGTAEQVDYKMWMDAAKQEALCADIVSGADKSYTPPAFSYRLGSIAGSDSTLCKQASASVTSLLLYQGSTVLSDYNNKLFAADYAKSCVYYFDNDDSGETDFSKANIFMYDPTSNNGFVDLKANPRTGHLYATAFGASTVFQIYAQADQPPQAFVNSTVTSGATPLTVPFDASASLNEDTNTTIKSYSWDFDGDGTVDSTTTSAKTSHTYSTAGVFNAAVTVTNTAGRVNTANIVILAGIDINLAITPASGTWGLGDTLDYTLSIDGPKSLGVTDSDVTYRALTAHCVYNPCTFENDCHFHEGSLSTDSQSGFSGSFVPIAHDLPSHVVIEATVTFSAGVYVTESFTSYPKNITVVTTTDPPGFPILLNGGVSGSCAFSSPSCQFQIMENNDYAISPSDTIQATSGGIYSLSGWKLNGGSLDTSKGATVSQIATGSPTLVAQFSQLSMTKDSILPKPIMQQGLGDYGRFFVKWLVPPANASCSASPSCVGIPGNCCPSASGLYMDCCAPADTSSIDHYVVYVSNTDGKVPSSAYPSAQTVASSGRSTYVAVPQTGGAHYNVSVAAFSSTSKKIGATSQPMTITIPSAALGTCVTDPNCDLPADPQHGSCPKWDDTGALKNQGLGVYNNPNCVGSGCFYNPFGASATYTGCAKCIFDRCLWQSKNPGQPLPDYDSCPSCVLSAIGVSVAEITPVDSAGNCMAQLLDVCALPVAEPCTSTSTITSQDLGSGLGAYYNVSCSGTGCGYGTGSTSCAQCWMDPAKYKNSTGDALPAGLPMCPCCVAYKLGFSDLFATGAAMASCGADFVYTPATTDTSTGSGGTSCNWQYGGCTSTGGGAPSPAGSGGSSSPTGSKAPTSNSDSSGTAGSSGSSVGIESGHVNNTTIAVICTAGGAGLLLLCAGGVLAYRMRAKRRAKAAALAPKGDEFGYGSKVSDPTYGLGYLEGGESKDGTLEAEAVRAAESTGPMN